MPGCYNAHSPCQTSINDNTDKLMRVHILTCSATARHHLCKAGAPSGPLVMRTDALHRGRGTAGARHRSLHYAVANACLCHLLTPCQQLNPQPEGPQYTSIAHESSLRAWPCCMYTHTTDMQEYIVSVVSNLYQVIWLQQSSVSVLAESSCSPLLQGPCRRVLLVVTDRD